MAQPLELSKMLRINKTSEEEMDKEEGTHYEYYSIFDLDADTITLVPENMNYCF